MTLPSRTTRQPLQGGTLLPDFLGRSNLLSRTGRTERTVEELATAKLSSTAAAGSFVRRRGYLFIAGWGQGSVAASQTNVTLSRYGTSYLGPLVLPFAGSIMSLLVSLTDQQTAGTLTVTVYIAGVASDLTAEIDGTNRLYIEATGELGEYTFDAGDAVTIKLTTSGSWAPTSADLQVCLEVSAT